MAKKNNRATRQTGSPGGSPTDGEIENALRELIEDDGCFDELKSLISDVSAFAVLEKVSTSGAAPETARKEVR